MKLRKIGERWFILDESDNVVRVCELPEKGGWVVDYPLWKSVLLWMLTGRWIRKLVVEDDEIRVGIPSEEE